MVKVINGNVYKEIDKIGDYIVDCVITSPPYYKLRKYDGTTKDYWDGDTSCSHNWKEYKDYKLCSLCGMWYGELGNEPTPQLYIKHLVDIFSLLRNKMSIFGTLWINIGTTMKDTNDLCIPELFCIEMINRGFYKKRTKIWYKTRTLPMSYLTDNIPDFEHIFHFGITNEHTFCINKDGYVVKPDNKDIERRFKFKSYFSLLLENIKYNTILRYKSQIKNKGNRKKISAGITSYGQENMAKKVITNGIMYRGKRCVWTLKHTNNYYSHSAPFPDDLPKQCILSGCPEYVCLDCGLPYYTSFSRIDNNSKLHKCYCSNNNVRKGLVLDPFAGSGTTLLVASELGRDAIGFEISNLYCDIINNRVKKQLELL